MSNNHKGKVFVVYWSYTLTTQRKVQVTMIKGRKRYLVNTYKLNKLFHFVTCKTRQSYSIAVTDKIENGMQRQLIITFDFEAKFNWKDGYLEQG